MHLFVRIDCFTNLSGRIRVEFVAVVTKRVPIVLAYCLARISTIDAIDVCIRMKYDDDDDDVIRRRAKRRTTSVVIVPACRMAVII
jgi:hypothetical protein